MVNVVNHEFVGWIKPWIVKFEVVANFEKHIFLSQTDLTRTGIISNCYNEMFEWDRVVALPRHKFVTGATLLQLE